MTFLPRPRPMNRACSAVPLRLLYLIHHETWKRKMVRDREHQMRAISKLADVSWWGPGWPGWHEAGTVQQNIDRRYRGSDPDLIVAYKPLGMPGYASTRTPRCIRYNEMYEIDWTLEEIDRSAADLVICHHRNDWIEWSERLRQVMVDPPKLVHIAHCAEATVFRDYAVSKQCDLMLVGAHDVTTCLGAHYPLRDRLVNILADLSSRYRCAVWSHPGYDLEDAHTDRHAIEFARAVSAARICVACSGVPRSRFSKYVEVPMCGTPLAADIPDESPDLLRSVVIELSLDWSDQRIKETLCWWLDHDAQLQERARRGREFATLYTQEQYAQRFVHEVRLFLRERCAEAAVR